MHYNWVELSQEYKDQLTLEKSVNDFCHINRLISIYAPGNLTLINKIMLSKLEMEGNFLNLLKCVYQEPTAYVEM